MATFKEMQDMVRGAQNKLEILNHLINYIEESFRPNGGPPRNTLLREDKTSVPDEAFEDVVKSLLVEAQALDKGLKEMLEAEVKPTKK